jgi:clathrin heavy chain
MFIQQFNQCLASGDIQGAARVAGQSPGGMLRNQETINKFKALPTTGGTPPPVVYFSTLLEITTLNELESLELCRAVLNKGQIQMVETWLG